MNTHRTKTTTLGLLLTLALLAACATAPAPRSTQRDKTARGAGYGAAAGAVSAVLLGNREADEILAGAAIGAVVGGGVGLYLDAQEEKLGRIPGTTVERVSRDTLLIHFESDVLFAVDSANLSPASRGTLGEVTDVLHEYRKTAVIIQGHTDSTGTEVHNQALSERRAKAVHNEILRRGVDAQRLVAVGYGEGYPVATNATADGRRQNRRVDILLRAKAR